MSGNIAFKRDLQNQGERAIDTVMAKFRSGGVLSTATARAANVAASNYSAKMLTVNAQGIPDALQSDTNFLAVGVATNDITPSTETTLANQAVSIRYVVDRMCNDVGDEKALGSANCLIVDSQQQPGASFSEWQNAAGASLNGNASAAPQGVVYRLTVRVQGPRNTESFFQSTFTAPSS
ncbi:MAG: hypothetical protein ABUU24_04375 [Variovorax sp.]